MQLIVKWSEVSRSSVTEDKVASKTRLKIKGRQKGEHEKAGLWPVNNLAACKCK